MNITPHIHCIFYDPIEDVVIKDEIRDREVKYNEAINYPNGTILIELFNISKDVNVWRVITNKWHEGQWDNLNISLLPTKLKLHIVLLGYQIN